jgi:four helix bundle protein
MKEYLEQQLKKKAHELVMLTFRVVARAKGQKGAAISLRQTVSKIPVGIFEGQARDFDEDKIRYFSGARSAVFEARYYLDLLYNGQAITYYSYRQIASRLDLLDKVLVSRITSIDKRAAKEQYKNSIRARYIS